MFIEWKNILSNSKLSDIHDEKISTWKHIVHTNRFFESGFYYTLYVLWDTPLDKYDDKSIKGA